MILLNAAIGLSSGMCAYMFTEKMYASFLLGWSVFAALYTICKAIRSKN